jgi:hypothetical protein
MKLFEDSVLDFLNCPDSATEQEKYSKNIQISNDSLLVDKQATIDNLNQTIYEMIKDLRDANIEIKRLITLLDGARNV